MIHLNPPLKTYGEGSSLSFSCQHGPVECEVGIQTILGTWVCSQQDVCLFALNWVNWCKFCGVFGDSGESVEYGESGKYGEDSNISCGRLPKEAFTVI